MNIIWMPEALDDMDAMFEYYVKKDPKAAITMYNGILDDVDLFAANPFIGAIEPLIYKPLKTYRSLVVSKGKNKIIYYVENETIYIARIWDCRQNPDKLMKSVR